MIWQTLKLTSPCFEDPDVDPVEVAEVEAGCFQFGLAISVVKDILFQLGLANLVVSTEDGPGF